MPISMKIVEAQPKTGKRFTAIFRLHKGGKIIKITHFGQRGGKTYIDEGDKEKRKNFRARHKGDLKTKDFKRAGFLSMGLLWGEHTSLKKNIEDYKKKFNLD
ncbi:MAG: hypothetical protein CL662_01105 [Bacteroidetes bacterium]|nr:hypothetical protein [Bacteroidota bacterium]|tara:strand:+ start:136 stop:441 length:306 start_codon:yes stop_codon:yes gene_type:complete